ncbi:ACP S-malonyltransferase [Bradyrhizobium sp. PMVTL-01]|uniref:ACP S-malonyltransferase n=1 Tax=Bradyrhizobium sp. PMVTL-01 TaxID=3434999 RepID=UPI003F706D68
MAKKTALVVAPGRGTYNQTELGYLTRFHGARSALIAKFDAERVEHGQEAISAMDGAEKYSASKLTRGDNASALIYACAYSDFLAIDREAFDIVAVTGNSMGWYTALACAGALTPQGGFVVVNTMGTLMQEALIGGQTLYPFVDDDWREIPGKRAELLDLIDSIPGLHLSIDLGGMLVFGGEDASLKEAERRMAPVGGRFPMRLTNHAAFHTRLQEPVSTRARATLPMSLFAQPECPLIDGRGEIWFPGSRGRAALWDYTLGHQVTEAYDFTAALTTGIREYAPDVVIILGPGTTLGGAVAQILIARGWRGLTSKCEFMKRQTRDPLALSLGIEEQRALAVVA